MAEAGKPSGQTCSWHYEGGGKCNMLAHHFWADEDLPFLCQEHFDRKQREQREWEREDAARRQRLAVKVGDWVQVYAQVTEVSLGGEMLTVELFSKTDQYQAAVLADRTVKCEPPEGIAQRCTHLVQIRNRNLLARCTSSDRHAGPHSALDADGSLMRWADATTVGYLEER